MKGHVIANCPNRRSGHTMMSSRDQECDCCFSSFHKTNECPTWWRIYEYFSEAQQHATLARRLENKGLLLGKGSEAYIADDEWCYNCGGVGHWGDDCNDARIPPNDHCAFSAYNVMKSLFWDPTSESQHKKSKSVTTPNEQWRGDVLDEVGRKGRVKARLALQKHERGEGEGDWFGSRRGGGGGGANVKGGASANRNGAGGGAAPKDASTEPKKIRFGFSLDAKKKTE
ncbi:hypothetical protein BJ165DRAFT_642901 [Panaeolus papilionaceus]|nr:hypothetical protein BJ165DRAFT_642901 [Panaeolus papilionaceus]